MAPYNPSGSPQQEVNAEDTMRLQIVMTSCAERQTTREATLRSLADTDWGREPVHIQMDRSTATRRQERIEELGRLALQAGLNSNVDYLLYVEDDLEFNQHFRHNLTRWQPLAEDWITMAGLYNPNLRSRRQDKEHHYFEADPESVYGSQGMLLSRGAAEFIVEHWLEVAGMPDIKISRLAARLGKPLYYHTPSLVQHMGKESVWGGGFHQALDFDRTWKARG